MSAKEVRNTLEYFADRITALATQIGDSNDTEISYVRIACSELHDELKSVASSRHVSEEAEYFLLPAVREVMGRLPEARSDLVQENWLERFQGAKSDLDYYLNSLNEDLS